MDIANGQINRLNPLEGLSLVFRLIFFFLQQDLSFENPFYEPPVILVSARHDNFSLDSSGRCNCNALTVWIEVNVSVFFFQFLVTCLEEGEVGCPRAPILALLSPKREPWKYVCGSYSSST